MQAIDAARNKWDSVAPSLRALKRHFGVTDQQIADALGLPEKSGRQQIQARLAGSTSLSYWEMVGLAAFFDVPEEVLFRGPDVALRWILDHPSEKRPVNNFVCLYRWAALHDPGLAVPA